MHSLSRALGSVLVGFLAVGDAAAQDEPGGRAAEDVELKAEWFQGIDKPGACTVLTPDAGFVERNLTKDGIAQRRVALVIGNGAYQNADWKLPNPRNDAAGVSRLLQSVGFEVHVVLDASASAIEACAAKASGAPSDLALLYYSGHGIQLEYANYLVATDVAGLDRSLKGFVSLDKLVTGLRQSSRALLVFLDACRDNPLASQAKPGLAPEEVAPRAMPAAQGSEGKPVPTAAQGAAGSALSGGELFVAFSTSPNTTASDGGGRFSPFTASFLKHAATPGWLVQRVVAEVTKEVGEASNWAQTPWSRSSLTHEVYFNGGVDPASAKRASDLKAAQSRDRFAKCDRKGAIAAALEGLPERFSESDTNTYRAAYEALYWAVRSRSVQLPVAEAVHTSFSPDGAFVATVSQQVGDAGRKDGLTLWETSNGQRIAELLPPERSGTVGGTLGPAKFSGDGRWVIHVDPVKEAPIIWEAATGRLVRELPKVPGASGMMVTVPKVEFSASGKYALAVGGGVRLYDAIGGKTLWTLDDAFTMAASIGVVETYVLTWVATMSGGGGPYKKVRTQAFGIGDKKRIWSIDVDEESWGAYSVLSSGDGRLVGVTTSGEALILLEPATGASRRIVIPRAGMAGFSISPDLKYLAVAASDQSTSQPDFYDIETSEKITPPLEERAALDIVCDATGAEVGVPWFAEAGDIWRKGVMGPALYEAATSALSEEQRAAVASGRARFR